MQIPMLQEKELLLKLRYGDEKSFNTLYTIFCGKVYNFILRISGGDRFLAEEITQNTFIKIWEKRSDLETDGSFSSLLFTISKNLFINEIRHKVRETIFSKSIVLTNDEAYNSTEKDIEFNLLEERINQLLLELPPARRQIYILSKLRHYSNKEIASLLSISENTVESQLTKASKHIRSQLAPYVATLSAVNTYLIINQTLMNS